MKWTSLIVPVIELITITHEVVESARRVLEQTRTARGHGLIDDLAIAELRQQIEHYCQLGDRVIDQAYRRVLEGEPVPNAEKIYSIFEPHTDLIKRGKVLTPVEFGHKVFLAESAQGLITQYEVLDGNPYDEDHVQASLDCHRETFGPAPELYGSDPGFYSQNNVKACQQEGVKVVCIPQRGGKKTRQREVYEKSPAFKMGQRFRAGIEGRISVLFRGRGMKRCLALGRERFELLVGVAVLANNLMPDRGPADQTLVSKGKGRVTPFFALLPLAGRLCSFHRANMPTCAIPHWIPDLTDLTSENGLCIPVIQPLRTPA